jgi:integrase
LLAFFGDKTLSAINGDLCRAFVKTRSTPTAARDDLTVLRSAINHHRQEGHCEKIVSVVLPEKPVGRERWCTRSEAAKLLWTAWRFREMQKGQPTDRRTRRHVARFILIALYTGTRAGSVCAAALEPTEGRGWIDLDRGNF